MTIFTLDFENFFRSKENKGTPGPLYSLKSWTYEEYLFGSKRYKHKIVEENPKVHGFGIKEGTKPAEWISGKHTKEALKDFFPKGNDHKVIGHNMTYDASIMNWYYGVSAGQYLCTQSMSKAIWQTGSSSLDALAKRCFPKDPEKWKRKEDLDYLDGYRELSEEQEIICAEYCKQDVECTFNSFGSMWQMGFPEIELEVIDILIRMFTDRPFQANRHLLKRYQKLIQGRRTQAIENAGVPEKVLGSNPQFADYLLCKHGILVKEVPSPTKKNPNNTKLPLAKDDIDFIHMREKHPELEPIWKGRIASKSNQEITRVQRFLDHSEPHLYNAEGRLASYLGYYNAHTGRCGGGNSTNHQNLGRKSKLRHSLQAPEGQMVVVRDLSNIEARLNLWFCGQLDQLQIIKEGGDIYNDMASKIYGYPVFRKRKEPEHATPGFVGKTAVLGLGYNMGNVKFQLTLATGSMGKKVLLSEDKCIEAVRTYRTTNHKITAMWRFLQGVIQDMADPHIEPYYIGRNDCVRVEYRRLVLPNGLALNYPGLRMIDHPQSFNEFVYWNGEFEKKIYGGLLLENLIQSLAFIVLKYAMVRAQRRFDQSEHFARMALNVHDELVAVTGEKYAEEADRILDEELCRTPEWADDELFLETEGGISRCYNK